MLNRGHQEKRRFLSLKRFSIFRKMMRLEDVFRPGAGPRLTVGSVEGTLPLRFLWERLFFRRISTRKNTPTKSHGLHHENWRNFRTRLPYFTLQRHAIF